MWVGMSVWHPDDNGSDSIRSMIGKTVAIGIASAAFTWIFNPAAAVSLAVLTAIAVGYQIWLAKD